MNKILLILVIVLMVFSCQQAKKENIDNKEIKIEKKYQAKAPPTQSFAAEAFKESDSTTLRWLGMAGFFINSRGTTLMIDPLLGGFDMPIMIEFPIKTSEVPHLDAVFNIGELKVTLTPVDHAWQNENPEFAEGRHWEQEDATGFWIETPDGTIWATGDSRLMPEHLTMPTPDAILFDFSDSEWHFTLEGAVKLANAHPNSKLLLHHWGSVDAPDFPPFNADPEELKKLIDNPERIVLLAPGESFTLTKINK